MRRRLRWRWVAVAVVAATMIVAAVLWFSFQRIPGWYKPVSIAPAEVQHVKDDLVVTLDDLTLRLLRSAEPFEYRLTQDQLNAWLAIRQEIWPLSREWLGESLSDPFISVDEDGIRLAATLRVSGLQTVASAFFELSADDHSISVRLAELSGGSLPIPESWVRAPLAELDHGVWPAGKRSPFQVGATPLPPLEAIFEGIEFGNAWVWQNGKQPFRISRLRLEKGAILLTIEPLPRHRSSN